MRRKRPQEAPPMRRRRPLYCRRRHLCAGGAQEAPPMRRKPLLYAGVHVYRRRRTRASYYIYVCACVCADLVWCAPASSAAFLFSVPFREMETLSIKFPVPHDFNKRTSHT